MENLDEIRKKIDECDRLIISKLRERFNEVEKVLRIKKAQGLPLFDRKREDEIINNIHLMDEKYSDEIADIYRQIMKSSRKKQGKELLSKKLFIIGYMGSGKSTVALELAQLTGFDIIDTDKKIEAKTNMKVSTIFEKAGENYFRDLETILLKEIREEDHVIVSCGGGMILRDENIKIMKEMGKVIFLNGSIKTLLDRIRYDKNRPILTAMFHYNDLEESELDEYEIFELELNRRMPAYLKAADIVIDVEDKTPEEIAEEILQSHL
ncbi:MAG: shikimate kinase [Bacilli bacterium]|nr:shikimate kinase [Bacilli bacterium]